MPQKSGTFCISWKETPWWTIKKPTKHWSQQNWFVDVSKSSQMHHWSKAKAAKLEKNNIINTIKGIKWIKFIYTCKSQVEKRNHHLTSHIQ
jgi:plasmid rolling circle replication initiator protein Rep